MIERADEPKLICRRCGAYHAYYEPLNCHGCGALLVAVGDGLPTMGEEAESELSKWMCMCGQPDTAGVMHRIDAPCYIPERVA